MLIPHKTWMVQDKSIVPWGRRLVGEYLAENEKEIDDAVENKSINPGSMVLIPSTGQAAVILEGGKAWI